MIKGMPGPGRTSSTTPVRVVVEPPTIRRLFLMALSFPSAGTDTKLVNPAVPFPSDGGQDGNAVNVRDARW
ncbi:MAG: hypothetical protein RLZZ526_1434 [Actinomycetota bacterium]